MDLTYEVQGRSYTGYMAKRSRAGAAPGVLVIHGGGGLGAQAKQRAEMLAEMGYVAFAPDLFGEPVNGLAHAKSITHGLTANWSELRLRCNAGLELLRGQPDVEPHRLAAIGFCFGGQAALELGRSGAELSAIVGFHSQLATPRPEDSQQIKAKVLVSLGDQDCFVSADDRTAFMENMSASGIDCQLLLFSGVGHSFTDPFAEASGVPGLKYDARADRRAWAAMHALFDEAFEQ